jgi:threonine dehydrogenase-like Zn-dependent dehydrogenase
MARRAELLTIAREVGADEAIAVQGNEPNPQLCDVVIDCTGSPEGLDLALRAARREVHLKSTHGRPAAGLRRLTALVVDELSIQRLDAANLPPPLDRPRPVVAWLSRRQPPRALSANADLRFADSPAALLERLEAVPPSNGLPRVDATVVDSVRAIEAVIRPCENRQVSLVRPRGAILLAEPPADDLAASPLVRAIWERGLRLSSSRCGNFAAAIALLESDQSLRAVAPRLITHRFPAARLTEAFAAAAGRDSIKAVIEHEIRP